MTVWAFLNLWGTRRSSGMKSHRLGTRRRAAMEKCALRRVLLNVVFISMTTQRPCIAMSHNLCQITRPGTKRSSLSRRNPCCGIVFGSFHPRSLTGYRRTSWKFLRCAVESSYLVKITVISYWQIRPV